MDDYPDNLRTLYFEFGRAAEMAQVMETEAGNLALAFVSLAFDPGTITDEERRLFRAIVDDVNSRTFGNLLRQIRKIGTVSDGIEDTINAALEKRNYLVHKFFRHHNLQINSDAGREEMIAELGEIHRALSSAHTVLAGMTHTFSQAFGRPNVSPEEGEELMRRGKRIEI
ncbi:MAG TPA: hypothetical protein VHB46_15965 [Burkholderiales bacterium]|nr:hypothetical protein [Burkholderiales bacterium]